MEALLELRCYKIIRYYRNGKKRTIKLGVTEADARAHCGRSDTKGPDWFDGYDYIKGCRP